MKCANCGNPMNEGDRFCMMCGFKAAEEVVEAAATAAPVEMPSVAPVENAPAFETPDASPMEDRLPEPPPFQPGSAEPVAENRLPEPPPFAPGSSEVTGEPAYQPEVPSEFTQPEQPSEPVQGVPSAPVVGGTDAAAFSSSSDIPAPAPEAPKASIEDMFQRRSWKDEGVNNGGIVNRGPK